jgi:hypothetical protein
MLEMTVMKYGPEINSLQLTEAKCPCYIGISNNYNFVLKICNANTWGKKKNVIITAMEVLYSAKSSKISVFWRHEMLSL